MNKRLFLGFFIFLSVFNFNANSLFGMDNGRDDDFNDHHNRCQQSCKKRKREINRIGQDDEYLKKRRKIEEVASDIDLLDLMKKLKIEKNENYVKLSIDTEALPKINLLRLETLRHTLEKSPDFILNSNSCLCLDKEFKRSSFMDFVTFFQSAQYPELSFFNECDCLDRSVRSKFEDHFTSAINRMNNLVYVGFGSGDLFADTRILTKLLVNQNKIGSIHLIDLEYKHAIKALRGVKENGSIQLADIFGAEEHVYTVFKDMLKFAQFINFLSNLSGQKMELYLYENVMPYLNLCKVNENFKADLIIAMDYDQPHVIIPQEAFKSDQEFFEFTQKAVVQKMYANLSDEYYMRKFYNDRELYQYLNEKRIYVDFRSFPSILMLCSKGIKKNGHIAKMGTSDDGSAMAKMETGPQKL